MSGACRDGPHHEQMPAQHGLPRSGSCPGLLVERSTDRRISVRTKVEACAGPLFDLRGKPRFMIKALPLAPSDSDESHYSLALHCFLKREASQWVLLEVLDVLA
ncbi:hypothetical protein SAMN03159488_03342 [Pseudomonas sp. NFIX10]|nr:hypothetical protein SAMN03159488_03342 [Pseudomonas sp. NFIX10]SFF44423.1 hypothetical protein SAMN03159367_04581 [Pseudomonas sp. NFACC06-1]